MEFKVEAKFNATPQQLYKAWLNSKSHSKMTGGEAVFSDIPGARFSAWNGYIEGENLDLEKDLRIVQTWRTTEFIKNQEDSLIEIHLIPIDKNSTKLILTHSNLEDHDIQYKQGWKDHYFTPMKKYFSK